MRIIQVNKFLYRKAGAEAYVLDLAELLKAHGHEVMLWGTDHNALPSPVLRTSSPAGRGIVNCPSPRGRGEGEGELFVRHINFDRREGFLQDLKKFGHMVWSRESARRFEAVVREFKPELIHIHNIYHHISPSILAVARRHAIPVVMTVHDYHLINPNYTLYDHGEICERRGLRAIAHRCIKNSFVASVADVIEWNVHRWMKIYEKNIARYLVPTEFVKGKLVEGGMDAGKITVVPLPVTHNSPQPSLNLREGDRSEPPLKVRGGRGSYILYAGRVTEEKGIYLVFEMAKRLPEIDFKIAGDGPELNGLELGIRNYELGNIELLGFVEKEKLQEVIAGAQLILVPSRWYDPSPFAVLEAMAEGKVVVASKIGGIPELIGDGETGFLIPSPGLRPPSPAGRGTIGDSSPRGRGDGGEGQWIDTIRKIYDDEKLLARVGRAAQEYVRRVHNPEKHYEKIMEMYKAVGH